VREAFVEAAEGSIGKLRNHKCGFSDHPWGAVLCQIFFRQIRKSELGCNDMRRRRTVFRFSEERKRFQKFAGPSTPCSPLAQYKNVLTFGQIAILSSRRVWGILIRL
jgi:hypothetical protein